MWRAFDQLEIDLSRINKNHRSNFTGIDVVEMFLFALNHVSLVPVDIRKYSDEICSYFIYCFEQENNSYKLVFCICSDKPSVIGIITLFRLKKGIRGKS
jgi:hypothetical protein